MDERRMTLMGVAAMLPGMQLALDVLQAQINEYRTLLQSLQVADGAMPKRRGRPPGPQKNEAVSVKLLAAPEPEVLKRALTPAGRKSLSAAMKKRWAVAKKRGVNLAAPAKKQTGQAAAIKGYWAKMTPAQRKAEMARRTAKGLGRKGSNAKAAAA